MSNDIIWLILFGVIILFLVAKRNRSGRSRGYVVKPDAKTRKPKVSPAPQGGHVPDYEKHFIEYTMKGDLIINHYGKRYLVTDNVERIEKIKEGDRVFFNLDAEPLYHGSINNAKDLLTVDYVSADSIVFKEKDGAWDFLYRKNGQGLSGNPPLCIHQIS